MLKDDKAKATSEHHLKDNSKSGKVHTSTLCNVKPMYPESKVLPNEAETQKQAARNRNGTKGREGERERERPFSLLSCFQPRLPLQLPTPNPFS